MTLPMSIRETSGQRMNVGIAELRNGDLALAVQVLRDASSIDPSYFAPWFNLGLAYKRLRDWPNALDVFLRAWRRLPANVSAELYTSVLWNVGISASIVGAWFYAHEAWKPLHPQIVGQRGDQPPSIPMGLVWVARQGFPPVLSRRLDPVRAQVVVPDAGDDQLSLDTIVVHDGERVGAKPHGKDQLAIFPVLHVVGSGPGALQAFEQFQSLNSENMT